MDDPSQPLLESQHIKRVSRIKHAILQKYLPAWATILGSAHRRLNYFDCYAGAGRYEFEGKPVDGSPLIAVKFAKDYLSNHQQHSLRLVLTEKNKIQKQRLDEQLHPLRPYPTNLSVEPLEEDSQTYIADLLAQELREPSFFMIDPYGHPLAVPVINRILSRPRTEALITLMWYQINRDLSNPVMQGSVDCLFGDQEWRHQAFMQKTGLAREASFVDYFISKLKARYVWPFRIGFDPEDPNMGERTKYYLLHASNSKDAVLLMKDVMWPLGDEDGTFDFSGNAQGVLISRTPQTSELREILLREFAGRSLTFDDVRAGTWKLPFIEKHYRSVLQELRKEGLVEVTPVSSKKTGLGKKDIVRFPRASTDAIKDDQ